MYKRIFIVFFILFSHILYSQNSYQSYWKEVEQFELDGKFKSAAQVVDTILSKANRVKDGDQIVKSFIYKSKFALLLEEDAQKKIFSELKTYIVTLPFPTNQVLISVQAGLLEQYLAQNRNKIQNRTTIAESSLSEEFESWDVNSLVAFIADLYERSMDNPEKLKAVPIAEYKAILTNSGTSEKYRPTLYDFLAHRALDFHKIDRWYVNRPKERFLLSNPLIFSRTEEFVQESFFTIDSIFSHRKALLLFQNLETFHKDSDTTAYADVLLDRLKFARDNTPLAERDTLYIKRLRKLYDEFGHHEVSAEIGYEIAQRFYTATDADNAKNVAGLAGKRIEAHRICLEIIEKYPTSEGGLLCKVLKNRIEDKVLRIETEKNVVPDKPFLAKVSFQNVDSLFVSVYQIPNQYLDQNNILQQDSIALHILRSRNPFFKRLYVLPAKNDFYSYTTEIDLPGLPAGSFLIIASRSEKPSAKSDLYAYQQIQSTNLVLLSTHTETSLDLQVLHRTQGSPVAGVEIMASEDKEFFKSGRTGKDGTFSIRRSRKDSYDLMVTASFQGDTLLNYDNWLYERSNYRTEEEHTAKMFLFLDRSIYRPGQTLFFKGVLIEDKKGISRVVPNTYVTVIIYDANYQDLKEFRLRTNEFGSVHGEYQLPANVLTGEFSIEMDEDYNEDGRDDPYWYKIDDFEMAENYFSVEEYKRPRFEVVFEDVTQNLLVGDSVFIKGRSDALLGTPIKDAKVAYSVKRMTSSLNDRLYYEDASQVVAHGQTKTDGEGQFDIPFVAYPDSTLKAKHKPIFLYSIKADVTDLNGETRSSETTVRIGYHNLETDLTIPSELVNNKVNSFDIVTENLNDQPIPANLDVAIYKLLEPDEVLRPKPWDIVELPIIDKKKFRTLFPHEPYDSTDLKMNWPKGQRMFHDSLKISGKVKISLGDMDTWPTGAYAIEVLAVDDRSDSVRIHKKFDVRSSSERTITQNTLFQYQLLNTNYKIDGFIHLGLNTAAKELVIFVDGYNQGKKVFSQRVPITNGTASLKIPVDQTFKDQMEFNLYFVKYNSFYNQQFAVNFPEISNALSIETMSFRNKLVPDARETWSFVIRDSDSNGAHAEVLTAMYDASLDQFKEHEWNIDVDSRYHYDYTPRISDNGSFETINFRQLNLLTKRNVQGVLKNYHTLNWFGLNFGRINFTNESYLRELNSKNNVPPKVDGNISGIVTDESGMPLPGANVVVEGTTNGTQTDFDGFYSINAPIGSSLQFSYIGFITQIIEVQKSGSIHTSLTEDSQALDEVVITALGTQREKRALGAAVSYIDASSVSADIEQKLSGKAAGIQIVQTAHSSEDEIQIIIKKINSPDSANRPLFVIDGVIFSFDDNASDGITLSPKEIEDITVIKGSSATSIYGEQGKNGVVIITTKKGLEAALQVEARTDLKETAFFYPNMTTDSEGRIQVHFDTPQALTKWRFMLLAHTRDLAFGKLEKTVLTQKDLSIVPNYPRFIREKDSIQFSTKISNLTEKPISGIAILQLFDAITNTPINEIIQDNTQNKNFTIPAGNDVNVSWRIRIPEGLNAMQFKVIAKAGDIADGETKIIPVLSNRVLITESQPLWVQPGNTKEIRLEALSANSSQSLNNYRFTIEYTSNPAWFAIKSLPFLIEFPYECAEQTFARFYANAIAGDIVQKNPPIESVFRSWALDTFEDSPLEKNEDLKSVLLSESPWVREAGEESRNKARLASIFQKELLIEKQALSISKLKDMQLPSGGFPWFSGGRENNFITRYIVAGFGHLDKLGIASEYNSDVDLIVRKAVDYLDKDFIDSYKEQILESRDSSDFRLTNNAIHYLYMRSFNRGQNPLSEELEKITKRYLDACGKSWLTESLYNQGMIALVAHRFGEKELSIKILNALEEQAVYSEENGTYWKRNDGGYYWYKAPIETQALLIEAFSEIRNDIKLLDGLKLWLLKNKITHQWNSTKATSEAIYALLMHGSNWLSVSDNTTITLGNDRISNSKLDAVKKEAGTGYFKINWNKEEITPKMGNVKVENKSEVNGFGGIYWQYFEDLDKVAATKGVPLVVRKEIFKKEITETGERLNPIQENSALKLGDILTVRLEVISKESLEFIHLKDLRASGLEPLDVLSEYKWQDGLGYYQSTKDVATHFFFDNLPEGTYVFEYDLRINNVGNFAAGISTIQSMYAPEYSAHSAGKRISFE